MSIRFTGTFDDLKERLTALSEVGEWKEHDNHKQFRHENGGILNWYPSTGTINFQGRPDGKSLLQATVSSALASDEVASPAPEPADAPRDSGSVTGEQPRVLAPDQTAQSSESAGDAPPPSSPLLEHGFAESELVIGLVGAVGTDVDLVIRHLEERLKVFGYETDVVRVSRDIIPQLVRIPDNSGEYDRISSLMDAGNTARRDSSDNSVLALGVAAKIAAGRPADESRAESRRHRSKHATIVHSLKHPDEVSRLREIYPQGFYLLGIHSETVRRHDYLTEEKRLKPEQAKELMDRDEDEQLKHGQRTSDTFHLSDFFVRLDENQDRLKHSVWRILDVLFGHPYATPTFDEYAMFMAFSASLRSADLSRQVGAVIAKGREIVATGANDCPRCKGGLYWPEYDHESHSVRDVDGGRDYTLGEDANKAEQQRIIDDILDRVGEDASDPAALRAALEASRISDLTEYGRVVHAEMESLLACARNSIGTRGATLYCTTFPCHNCAKHIISAGLIRVVYVEPYAKSKAVELHSDAISLGGEAEEGHVQFEPFVGVGPRRFIDLFSMRLGSGWPMKRKDDDGQVVEWQQESARLRLQMLPCSYLDLEVLASSMFNKCRESKEERNDG